MGKGESSAQEAAGILAWPQFRALLRPHLASLLLALALMLVQSVATLAQPWLAGVLTTRLMFGQGYAVLLWVLFGLVTAQALLGYVVSIQLQAVSGRLVASAGTTVYAHLQVLPLAWHQERRQGDVLALLTGDVYRMGNYVTGTLVPLLPLLFTLAGALLMMLHLAPAIAIAVAVLMPLLFILLKLVGRRLRPLGNAVMQAWADQSALAEQNLGLLALIKAFATGPLEEVRYREKTEALYEVGLSQAKLEGLISPAVQVLGSGVVLLLLGTAGSLVATGRTGVGELVSLFLYGLVLVNPVSQLARVYGNTQSARGAMQRLRGALNELPESDAGEVETIPAAADIRFESVEFAYPGRPPLFSGFDLHIKAGETVALTGVNGAGKSTLIHLLLRLVEPASGRICIGGQDLRDFRLSALRGQIGLVAQQVMLFNASIAENIAYGHQEATPDAIEKAAKAARAHDFVLGLPDGYATVIGDDGVKLSGGQKQRISLARALLKDPPILILDEATAMFDPQGEREFISECRDVLKQRTVILISHRPASLALADRVLRLESGNLLEVVTDSR